MTKEAADLEINPFAVGQTVECTSFSPGYRGAWFRCEIKRFRHCKLGIRCMLKYLDFPADKLYRHKLYQYVAQVQPRQKRLTIRPEFPQVVQNISEQQHSGNLSSPVVRFNRDWEVGDYGEFLYTLAYWECQVIEVINQATLRVQCPEIPYGEGNVYDVEKQKLRPGLQWSMDLGLTVKTNELAEVPLVSLIEFPPHKLAKQKDPSTGSNSWAGANSGESSDRSKEKRKLGIAYDLPKGLKGLPAAQNGGGDSKGRSIDPSKEVEGLPAQQGGGEEEEEEEEDTDILPEIMHIEELQSKIGFFKDVLQHGVKEALRIRSEAEWEVSCPDSSRRVEIRQP